MSVMFRHNGSWKPISDSVLRLIASSFISCAEELNELRERKKKEGIEPDSEVPLHSPVTSFCRYPLHAVLLMGGCHAPCSREKRHKTSAHILPDQLPAQVNTFLRAETLVGKRSSISTVRRRNRLLHCTTNALLRMRMLLQNSLFRVGLDAMALFQVFFFWPLVTADNRRRQRPDRELAMNLNFL